MPAAVSAIRTCPVRSSRSARTRSWVGPYCGLRVPVWAAPPPAAHARGIVWRERFLCYRATANLANERHTMPRAWATDGGAALTSTRSPQYGPTQERVRAEREERTGHARIADAA